MYLVDVPDGENPAIVLRDYVPPEVNVSAQFGARETLSALHGVASFAAATAASTAVTAASSVVPNIVQLPRKSDMQQEEESKAQTSGGKGSKQSSRILSFLTRGRSKDNAYTTFDV